ncbi:apolipoprotein N-acyltransferase [Demequina lignilytica]|uniref:Apolipoprotein N-acyltransferase n=1 Tax=Demequina lignilytica TaxID=3051663 RepID=A0AB35ME29_9MICO|nr:apolipoprotein N-acyltransferase [Demequina sp. SYSU T0a273]MDN4482009.1 apolipoprotein N-acyltransferase [Demequina sp. SYSU T0a273]
MLLRLRNLLLAAGAGAILNLAFPDTGWWPLGLVAVALLWWALERASAWSGLALGWVFGVAFLLPHLWWAYLAVGPVPWVALCVAEGLFFGLIGMAWAHARRSAMLEAHAWAAAPVFALIWVASEQLRSMVPFGGFPWGRIGYAFVDAPVARLAWAGGVPLVSLVVVLAGALLGLAFESLRRRRALGAAFAPVIAIGLLGVGYVVPLDSQAQDGTIRLGIVQGNTPDRGLDSFDNAREVTRNHLDETLRMVEDAPGPIDLVVWPENAADYDPRVDDATFEAVTTAAQAADAPILLGTVDYTPVDGRYNTSLLLSTSGTVIDSYSKQRPAPFAEYIPLRSVARNFSPWVDRVVDMIPGTSVATMDVPLAALDRTVRIGTVICFEVAYDSIVRESVAAGAELLIVQTNNATFGRTAESTQQLQMTRLRAIETGRVTVQASTVGVSAVVDPSGRVLQDTELFEAASMYAHVGLRTETTPAVRFGWFIGWGLLIVPVAIVLMAVRRRIADRYDW